MASVTITLNQWGTEMIKVIILAYLAVVCEYPDGTQIVVQGLMCPVGTEHIRDVHG